MFGGYGYFSMTNSDTTSAADFRAVQSFSPDLTSELERLFINEPRTTAPAPTTPYTWTVPVRSRHGSSSDSGIRWSVYFKKLHVKILQNCYSRIGMFIFTDGESIGWCLCVWKSQTKNWWAQSQRMRSYLLSRGPWWLLRNIYRKPQSFLALQNACYTTITVNHPSTSTISLFSRCGNLDLENAIYSNEKEHFQ